MEKIIIIMTRWYLFQEYKVGFTFKIQCRDFSGGAVVKNPPASAGDTGSIPGPGRSHMSRSN